MAQRRARVRFEQVDKSFGERRVLRDLTLTIQPGAFVAVVGRSGSGKSTLLRLLCGLEQPTAGKLTITDERGSPLSDAVRVVFQEPRLLPWQKVLANVSIGRPRVDPARAREVLSQVGLADRTDEYPGVLSGGQKQRVALARALVHDPAMLLLDEPFGALDALTRGEAQTLVEGLWARAGFTAVLVTHDVAEAVLLSDRVLVVEDGRIVEDVRVDLPRPRAPDLPEFGRLTAALLDRVLGRASKPTLAAASHTAPLVEPQKTEDTSNEQAEQAPQSRQSDHQTRKLETTHDTVQSDPVGT
ncbi:MAG: aliphatic sulfonate transporter, nucleotide binding/ATPase protein [Pseudomonadota bacterium]|jgi:sulfonate transport system ATP-binding protein